MSHQRNPKRSLLEANSVANSLKECSSTPYKRRKQTGQALEALGQLIKDSSVEDLDNNKFNKNDILSLTLSRLVRRKYWPSNLSNTNVQLASGVNGPTIENDLTGFIIVLNTTGRIILISDNVEYYLRKNVRSLYPQLTSIYDCIGKSDHDTIRQVLSTPTLNEKHAICTWILPRGKRPNRSHTETKSMLLTGHFFTIENDENKEPLFVARCEQILSSTPNVPTNSIGSTSTTTLRFVLTDQLDIIEISSNTKLLLGYEANDLIDQSIHRILPNECLDILEQAKQNCLTGEHCTSMNVLDLFTHDGDRLTFLCNTHMLTEGRRKTMKLGFLAQLIDPSIRYECLAYANKQNIERQKTSVQQESIFMSNMIFNNSTKANLLMSPNDQCLTMNDTPKYKRQRVNYDYIENEDCIFIDQAQQTPQYTFAANYNNNLLSSPTQELGHIDELFNWIDEEKGKTNNTFSPFDDINDILGLNNAHEFGLMTPNISELNFIY